MVYSTKTLIVVLQFVSILVVTRSIVLIICCENVSYFQCEFVKECTTLFALDEEDWNMHCISVIQEFFNNPAHVVLTVFYDDDRLSAELGFPTVPVQDMTYFVRERYEILTPQNFHDSIMFGSVNECVDGTILNTIENAFVPVFLSNKSWPDSILHCT